MVAIQNFSFTWPLHYSKGPNHRIILFVIFPLHNFCFFLFPLRNLYFRFKYCIAIIDVCTILYRYSSDLFAITLIASSAFDINLNGGYI
jgi:hypothetical protein